MLLYDKLVRDRVPEIIQANGNLPVTRSLPAEEMLPALRAKMNEELAEYDARENDEQAIDELADLLELIFAIAARRGYGQRELMKVRADKAVTHGAFDLGVFLMETD